MTKEKLSPRQFLLIVNGPSCGGKSTTANLFLERYGNIFNAKYDHIKWLISDYDRRRDIDTVYEMTLEVARIALKNNLSVLKEGGLFEPENYVQLAKDFNVPFFVANVSAPEDVLEQRFLDRIEAKKNGAKIANVDPDRFRELNKIYLSTKMESPLEFDSSKQSAEEIVRTISEYMLAHLE